MKKSNAIAILFWILSVLVGLGVVYYFSQTISEALSIDTTQDTADENSNIDPGNPPVIQVAKELLGQEASWNNDLSVASACILPTPVLTGSNDLFELAMYPTGFGGLAYQQLIDCSFTKAGDDQPVPSYVEVSVGPGKWYVWQSGDSLISATEKNSAIPETLTNTLEKYSCRNLSPTPKDASRNPNTENYTGLLTTVTVTTDLEETSLDPGSESQIITLQTQEGPTTPPDGIQGPPLPTPPIKPEELIFPGTRPTSIEVEIPQLDPNGPGCGWDFNGTVPPVENANAIKSKAKELEEQGKKDLIHKEQVWQQDVNNYLKALPTYNTQTAKWNAWVDNVKVIQMEWDTQLKALEDWEKEMEEYQKYQDILTKWEIEQSSLEQEWNRLVKECRDEAISKDNDPAFCHKLPKPDGYSETPPEIPPEPVKPNLWEPN